MFGRFSLVSNNYVSRSASACFARRFSGQSITHHTWIKFIGAACAFGSAYWAFSVNKSSHSFVVPGHESSSSSSDKTSTTSQSQTDKGQQTSNPDSSSASSAAESESSAHRLMLDGIDEFAAIVVGGGSGGCVKAYFLAKWMHEHSVPGHVLLLDRGAPYSPTHGPDPHIDAWYNEWARFSEVHDTIRHDGSAYAVTASSHCGMGGASTHDTRITFAPRDGQMARMAAAMGWPIEQMRVYYQAALDLMPLSRAMPGSEREAFFDAVVETLTTPGADGQPAMLQRMPKGHFDTQVIPDSIAEASLAMYESAARWTPAYFLSDGVRPPNLMVITNAEVDRVLIEPKGMSNHQQQQQQRQHEQPVSISLPSTTIVTTSSQPSSSCAAKSSYGNDLAATGVRFRHHGKVFDARVDPAGEVIVAAGSLHTPAILQRSGIGPADLLKKHGIQPLVDNAEVGHGVDHNEIAVLYGWLDKWNDPQTGEAPRGGVMGWPLVLFASIPPDDELAASGPHFDAIPITQAHFGAGSAEPYTSGLAVVASPNCVLPQCGPNGQGGFRVMIGSRDPALPAHVIAGDETDDYATMVRGLRRVVEIFERLRAAGVVGDRIEPPADLDLNDTAKVIEYIKARHGTAYHWMSTCQAGVEGAVADAQFRVRRSTCPGDDSIVNNLRVGSGASLPELSEANPHLSITAFAIAAAHAVFQTQVQRRCGNLASLTGMHANEAKKHHEQMLDELEALLDEQKHSRQNQSRSPGLIQTVATQSLLSSSSLVHAPPSTSFASNLQSSPVSAITVASDASIILPTPSSLKRAAATVSTNAGKLQTRAPGEESPALFEHVVSKHHDAWRAANDSAKSL